jgi:2Fe-2S ferredoxin
MTSKNPYLHDDSAPLPRQKYTLRIVDEHQHEHTLEVDPAKIPYTGTGRPGSILDIALGHAVEIDHACGGVCACATCHVIVRAGLGSCNPASDEEENMLDSAYGVTPQSRLACQCVPNGMQPVVVEVPTWNRNLARE